MATEYTITYTYTGQGNTSATRSVAFGKFKASGDTGRNIGQIKSVRYIHYHTSAGSMSWGLRGRLVFSDGTSLTSDQVYHEISGDVVKYENTFAELPTAQQFANLTSVQTLDTKGKTTSGGYSSTLYWRANSSYPMKLIVTFIEEPPVTYAPKIDKFEVSRCNSGGSADDEGQYIAATLKLSIGNSAGLANAQCRIYYAANAYPQAGVSQYVDVSSRIGELVSGVALNSSILTGVWSLGSIWNFAVVFTAGEETAIATASAARGTTSLHISDDPGGGAAIGGFSTGTKDNPKFESYVPAHFYAGIEGVSAYSSEEVKTICTWIDGKPIYRRVISISVTNTGNNVSVYTISGFGKLVNLYGYVSREVGACLPPNFFLSTSNYSTAWVRNYGELIIRTPYAITGEIVVEYTKSTD